MNIPKHEQTQNKAKYFNYYYLLIIPVLLKILQLVMLDAYGGDLSEGWFSDIAYNLNKNFTGLMAPDIPFGSSWNTGIGKSFLYIHHYFYAIFGVGLYQARLISYFSGILMVAGVFFWAKKFISENAAVLSAFILLSSPLLTVSLPNSRQDIMHCLFAFVSFAFISASIIKNNRLLFFFSGLISGLSVDISLRGIEIVLGVYLMYVLFKRNEIFSKNTLLLFAGSLIAFVYWLTLNIFPIGLDNYIMYQVIPASTDGGRFTSKTFLVEVVRVLSVFNGRLSFIIVFELTYFISLIAVYFFNRKLFKYAKYLIAWLIIMFIIMSGLEKTTYRSYLLIYLCPMCILAGAGLSRLFETKRIYALIITVLILFNTTLIQSFHLSKYAYHSYIKKDYNLKGYYDKLRDSVDTSKNIIGTTNHWYAFKDSQYYGGQFYMSRVITILKELKPSSEYNSDIQRESSFLEFLKKRKIEYIIADEYFKPAITVYFGGKELPKKNFMLINTIYDSFMGKSDLSLKPPYKTEIYKVISYRT
jgi:hypothetical protein